MAVLRIRYLGDPVLRKKAEPVSDVDEELDGLIEDMIQTMYANQGVGLAAPQVGVSKRVFIYDNLEAGYGMDPQVVINPEITCSEGSLKEEEGCLSIPEVKDIVERSRKVILGGFDRRGQELKIEAEGLRARVFQHEIDHLNGILFIDRLGAVKKRLALSRWNKIRKELQAGKTV